MTPVGNAEQFDAIVIGCGPAGSAAAAVLAEKGRRVLVLEREKFPRYHIGESLLPFTYYPLERLGLVERMRQSRFVKKYSVQFVSPSGKASQPFYFFSRYDMDVAQTWQVLRSEFDLILMENARGKEHAWSRRSRCATCSSPTAASSESKPSTGTGARSGITPRSRWTAPGGTRSRRCATTGGSKTRNSTRSPSGPTTGAHCGIPESTPAPRPWPTSRTRAGSGTFPSTTT